jgi:hypothetical protein
MATVKTVYAFRVKAGRFEDWRALSHEGDKLSERHGGGAYRYFAPAAAGPESAQLYAALDFPDAASWGRYLDDTGRDPESHLFLDRMVGRADSPVEDLSAMVMTEIPLGLEGAPGPILSVYTSTVEPGRLDEAVALGTELAPISTRQGATSARLYVTGPAGSASGQLVYVAEYPSFEAFGRSIDAMHDDADVAAASRRVAAAESPFRITQQALYSELP